MNHIDEHTIEMYVLGSELVTERRGEIEAHFKECHGCRTLAKQIEEFYKKAEEELEEVIPERARSKALVRSRSDLPTMQEPYGFPAHYPPITTLAKVFYFIRKHPVTTVTTGFVAIAALGWFLNDAIRNFSSNEAIIDRNPAYSHLNTDAAAIEIYNKDNQLLYGLPSKGIYKLAQMDYAILKQNVVIADLDNNNNNEVITILPVGDKRDIITPLSIFSYEGKLVREIFFEENIQFRTTKYDSKLAAQNLLCADFTGNGKAEMIVTANSGRSPNIVYRLSNEGVILGRYFHFGNCKIRSINLGLKRNIVLFGQNDVGEPESLSYGIIIVLDPTKLDDKSEGSDSRGFGLPVSDAEEYVIRFPLSDMNYVWNTQAIAGNLKETEFNKQKTITVWVGGIFGPGGLGTGDDPAFEYIFDDQFKILEVKYHSQTVRVRKLYNSQGKLNAPMDTEYLKNLKNGVRYWDGKEWQKEPTKVKH